MRQLAFDRINLSYIFSGIISSQETDVQILSPEIATLGTAIKGNVVRATAANSTQSPRNSIRVSTTHANSNSPKWPRARSDLSQQWQCRHRIDGKHMCWFDRTSGLGYLKKYN